MFGIVGVVVLQLLEAKHKKMQQAEAHHQQNVSQYQVQVTTERLAIAISGMSQNFLRIGSYRSWPNCLRREYQCYFI